MAPRRRWSYLWILGALLVLGGAMFLLDAFYGANTFPEGTPTTFFVSKGQSFRTIVDSLETQHLIRSRALFVFVGRILGGTGRMQIGKYVFTSGISNADLFSSLRSGRDNSLITVTVPEGYRARSQSRLYARTLGIDSSRFFSLVKHRAFIADLGISDTSLEGYLLPDTYGFYWQQDEAEIIERMVAQFRAFYGDSLIVRERELGWTTKQILTLASIVEAEAVRPEERQIIAGVYVNRIQKGMKLEADPTVQYGLPDPRRRVLYADLRVDHPYNTYLRKGLPPGPINNPGRSSIIAALYPARHRYLYFVADGNGGHRFARTYEEHRRNVSLYRRARKAAAAAAQKT
jgi:UPF0755 protein